MTVHCYQSYHKNETTNNVVEGEDGIAHFFHQQPSSAINEEKGDYSQLNQVEKFNLTIICVADAQITNMNATNTPYHRCKYISTYIYICRYVFTYMYMDTHEKSKIPFSYMLCLFCKRAYRGTKPEESFG